MSLTQALLRHYSESAEQLAREQHEVLAELVRLKDLRAEFNRQKGRRPNNLIRRSRWPQELLDMEAECIRLEPLAWARARALLSSTR